MANLNEYLGAIVAHLSQARVLADLESAKIAMTYAEHDLLRHFSIPRMRIDDVELTIPVAVSELETPDQREVKALDKKLVAALTYSEIVTSFGLRSVPPEMSDSVRKDISEPVDRLAARMDQDTSENVVREFASSVFEIVDKKGAGYVERGFVKEENVKRLRENAEPFKARLAQKLKSELTHGTTNSSLGNLKVIVESDKLKEKSPHTLVTIKMKVSEEALGWERLQDDHGNLVTKLMPE